MLSNEMNKQSVVRAIRPEAKGRRTHSMFGPRQPTFVADGARDTNCREVQLVATVALEAYERGKGGNQRGQRNGG